MTRSSRLSFLLGGILCCLTLFGYQSNVHSTMDGTKRHEETHVALGIPFSPWYESTETHENGRLVRSESRVHLLSWSSAVFLGGILSLLVWWRARPRKAAPEYGGGR